MKVAIDPGHGLSNRKIGTYDPGATHQEGNITFEEADIALEYGLALRQALAVNQISNFMTRTSKYDPARLTERTAHAADQGCDFFVSLHLNDDEDDEAAGIEVLFRDDGKDKPLASALQRALVEVTGFKDRRIKKRQDLAVLKFEPGPAVLVELGFIANDGNRNTLLKDEIRSLICKTIVDVLITFK